MPLPPSAGVQKAPIGPLSALAYAVGSGANPAGQEPVRPVEPPERPQQRFASPRHLQTRVGDDRKAHPRAELTDEGLRPVRPRPPLPARGAAPFLVQMLDQGPGTATPPWRGHRDAALMGSDAYRAAGAEPPVYSETPSVFRLTI